MLNYASFPNQYLVDGVQRYLEHGIRPGDFLTAVLCNDLKEACGRADFTNRYLLFDIVNWLYNEAPLGSWGSPEIFDKVIDDRGVMGREAPQEPFGVVAVDEAVNAMLSDALEQGGVDDER